MLLNYIYILNAMKWQWDDYVQSLKDKMTTFQPRMIIKINNTIITEQTFFNTYIIKNNHHSIRFYIQFSLKPTEIVYK